MKLKTLFSILMLSLMIGFNSCTQCKGVSEAANDTTFTEAKSFVVENIISTDRQDMFLNYAQDYRWFETCIQLEDYLDDENCDGTVHSVSNVFQVVEEKGNGADVYVVLYSHLRDTTTIDVKHGFWVEDFVLNEEAIAITFDAAFEKLMEANCPKPHSKYCVLRKQIGPADANPQYIFGNSHAQVYVDAVTGDVSVTNPVFPDDKGFTMPLGEWP